MKTKIINLSEIKANPDLSLSPEDYIKPEPADLEEKDFHPYGFITICNSIGIEVMFNKSLDAVYYRFVTDDKTSEIFEAEIVSEPAVYYEKDEDWLDTGFYHGETFYSLNDCMRLRP